MLNYIYNTYYILHSVYSVHVCDVKSLLTVNVYHRVIVIVIGGRRLFTKYLFYFIITACSYYCQMFVEFSNFVYKFFYHKSQSQQVLDTCILSNVYISRQFLAGFAGSAISASGIQS